MDYFLSIYDINNWDDYILKMYDKAYERAHDNELFLYLGKKYFIEKPKSEILTIYENNGIIEIEKTNYLLFKII